MEKNCVKCLKPILPEDDLRIIPVDRPYMNLYTHKKCHDEITDLYQFLTENFDLCYNMWCNNGKLPKVEEKENAGYRGTSETKKTSSTRQKKGTKSKTVS